MKKWKSIVAATLLLALAAGCAPQPERADESESSGIVISETGSNTQVNIPLGRYVEEPWEKPLDESMNITQIKAVGEGFDIALTNGKEAHRFHSDDGKTWEELDAELLSTLPVPQDGYLGHLDWRDGVYYAMTETYTESNGTYHINVQFIRSGASGWEPVPIDWDATTARSGAVRSSPVQASGFFFGSNGDIYLEDQLDGLCRFSEEGELLAFYPIAWNGSLLPGRVAGLDSETGDIVFFDLDSGDETERVPVEAEALGDGYPTLFSDGSDLYLAGNGGVYRLASGGTLFEQMIRGDGCSLGKPSLYPSRAAVSPDGAFLMSVRENDKASLLHYRYDAALPSRPDREITVTMLYDQQAVRQAAIEFQMANPDVAVTPRVLLDGESAMTESDAVRQLNTELLAGKGPDVLVLDGLPMRSYEEKGVLADLSDVTSAESLLENVALSLRGDNGLFAVPARFRAPVMVAQGEEPVPTLGDLAALAAPGRRLLYDLRPEALLERFFPACSSTAVREDGSVDEAALARLLTDLKTLMEATGGQDFSEDISTMYDGDVPAHIPPHIYVITAALRFAYGRVDFLPLELQSFRDFRTPYTAMKQRLGTQPGPTLGYLSALPGSSADTRIFHPVCLLGVNAAGDVETAKRFVAAALSEKVQAADVDGGFAVQRAALENSLDRACNVSSSYRGPDGEELHEECTPAEAQTPLLELFETLNTPVLEDERLSQIVAEESKSFFDGGITAQQAASAIAGRVEAYLAE